MFPRHLLLVLFALGAQAQTPVEAPTRAPDAYNSWKLALTPGVATDPASIQAPPGFKVELLRSAQPDEDSWVSLAFDREGRITIGCEKKGLLRFTLGHEGIAQVERIDDTLLECRGLLYAYGALYAVANNSKALYRLRSTQRDGVFDEITELLQTGGGVGHGRNHLKLGPDGLIYIAHGNNVEATPLAAPDSPLRPMRDDRLIPCPWDPQMFDGDVKLPAGHILRTDPEGKSVQIVAGGFRNELDLAFNPEGEMFTFDADMEWDTGTPWYRPNRVNHVISGADYGWRRGTSKWPEYFPDAGPTAVNIGLASPTGVVFGTRSAFPGKWRRALYICDWSYGRIIAVHLRPNGSSYAGAAEPFINGRPLNVTDAAIGPDGALYFTTGGRRTQAGLYRVTYTGPQISEPAKSAHELAEDLAAAKARDARRHLESFHGRTHSKAVNEIWPHLGSGDLWIRHAARVALEWQPAERWAARALAEANPAASLNALMALARAGEKESLNPILTRLESLHFAQLGDDEQILVARVYQLALSRLGPPEPAAAARLLGRLDPLYPARAWQTNHLLTELLVYLNSSTVLAKSIPLLAQAERSGDLLHFLFHLRNIPDGWSPEHRRIYFAALNRADSLEGARDYQRALRWIRAEVAAALTPEEREQLGPLVEGTLSAIPLQNSGPQLLVKQWTEADLVPRLDRVARGRSFESGRLAFAAAQCAVCHRVGHGGGLIGPDLTGVAGRFNRRDLLASIVDPSRVIDEKYLSTTFTLRDGSAVTGTVEREDEAALHLRENPALPATRALAKTEIARRESSPVSPMPAGLLNILSENQILDLLAYLESGGDPNHAIYR